MVDLVLSKLGEDVHKQPNSLHVFICPKLMILMWERLMFKMDDLVLYGPSGAKFWLSSMQESFVLGFILPLIPHRHWRIRGSHKVLGLVRAVYLLLRESLGVAVIFLRQLKLLLNRVVSMSGVLERVLLLV